MLIIITNSDTVVVLFGDVRVELISLIKSSFGLLLFYCIFEIIANSEDLFGEFIAHNGRLFSKFFLFMSLLLAGSFFLMASFSFYEYRLTKVFISMFLLIILIYMPQIQKKLVGIKRGSIRESIKSQWNYQNFFQIMVSISTTMTMFILLVYDEFVDNVWVGSFLCILILAALRIQEMIDNF